MLHGGAPAADLDLAGLQSLAPNQRPWLAWRPSGSGSVASVQLPALPSESSSPMEDVSIYTPPGYDAKGARRYPVLYEAPFAYNLWDSSINVRVALDTMIGRGTVPAMIVVFVNAWRPPNDCSNAADCKHWMDLFIAGAVVSYVDSTYLTLPRPTSRALAGFSEGGYLAPALALRHPDTFGAAIAISGYFGTDDGGTNAWQPFGSDPADIAAASPIVAATRLPAADRARLFFIVVAQPRQWFFGAQATDFERLLASEGYGYKALDSNVGHGWDQVRQTLPLALETWAARLVALGAL
jgi:enterochelin esterase-like enzyme